MKRDMRKGLKSNPVGMIRKCLLLLYGVLLLAGCQSNLQTEIPEQGQSQEKIDISSLSVEKGTYSDYENACIYYTAEDSLYEFYRAYLGMYAYLFPGADFDDNHLFYFGANSNNQEGDDKVKTIGGNFEEFLAENKEDVYYLFYSPYFYEGQPVKEGTQNRFLELSSPVGTIMTNKII